MATIVWNIMNMERILDDDFVIVAHWTCTASESSNSSNLYGSQLFEYAPNQPGYIPFNDLTESVVIGWVHDRIGSDGVVSIETKAMEQLNKILNPVVITGLPWAQLENMSMLNPPQSPIAPDFVPDPQIEE